jgi:ADP-dependent NAD(P)H-hydrate dehydratase
MSERPSPQRIDARALRAWPLPALSNDADKEARGRIVVVAGSREIPGAALLAATAAMRMGAGKLVVATGESVALHMAFALPEARVIGLPETAHGGFALPGLALLESSLRGAHAAVIGPGLMDEDATAAFVAQALPLLAGTPVVLDALAMDAIVTLKRFDEPVLLTPHAGEMAHLSGASKDAVQDDPEGAALEAARRWNAIVAVKGPATLIAAPDGSLWRHEGGNCGLATSGSGDTLAGAIGGLAARGATLAQACAWGVALHAQAGDTLGTELGPVGYLARELPAAMLSVLRRYELDATGITD